MARPKKKKSEQTEEEKKELKKQNKILKNYIQEIKSHSKCSVCGEERWWVLDFHHLRDKKYEIPELARSGCSLDILKAELEKCIILCANCHRDLHHHKRSNNEKCL